VSAAPARALAPPPSLRANAPRQSARANAPRPSALANAPRPSALANAPRPSATQASLFEVEQYRVARRRAGTAPARPLPQVREPAPIQRSASSRATVSAMAAPEYSRSLVPFVAMCVAIVVGSLVAVLLLNTTMTQRAYQTRDMRTELAKLEDQRSELLATIEQDSSPQALAAAAHGLGMVPAPRVGFVNVQTGVVLAPGASG